MQKCAGRITGQILQVRISSADADRSDAFLFKFMTVPERSSILLAFATIVFTPCLRRRVSA